MLGTIGGGRYEVLKGITVNWHGFGINETNILLGYHEIVWVSKDRITV